MKVRKDYFYRSSGSRLVFGVKPYFLDFHKLDMNGDYEYPVHIHSNYELIIVVNSSYYCELNKIELTLKPGEFLIVKPGDCHQDHLYDGQSHYVLHFVLKSEKFGKQADIKLFHNEAMPGEQIGKHDIESSLKLLNGLAYESINSDIYSERIQDALLEVGFWKFVREIPKQVLSEHFIVITKSIEFQQRLYNVFDKHYNSSLNVERMAKQMGMSKRNLCYYCKDLLGITPAKALTAYRMSKALDLLGDKSLSIQDISDKLGFENPFHFSKVFKKIYGKSPAKYRGSL